MEGWVIALIIVAVIVLIAVIIICWAISVRNNFVRMRNTSEEAFATIDVYLKKRYDLIPNLVETVKGYAKHESETLQNVIAARNAAMAAKGGTEARINAENALTSSLRTLLNVVVEQYPQLQANTNFLDLQNQLKQIESELANARKYYNANAKQINTKMQTFPSNLIAKMMKLEKFAYYEIEEEARKNVKVQF